MIFRRRDEFRERFSIGSLVSAPFRKLAQLVQADDSIDTRERGISVQVVLTAPLRFLVNVTTFVITYWSSTRRGRSFLLGLPAVTVIAGAIASLIVFDYFTKQIAGRYRSLATIAVDSEDFDEAKMYATKLLSLNPADLNDRFRLAEVIANTDGEEQALERMRELAPDDEPVHAKAHLWIATYFVRNKDKVDSDVRSEQIVTHLGLTDELEPEFNDRNRTIFLNANWLANRYYYELAQEQPENSVEANKYYEKCVYHLSKIVSFAPQYYPILLDLDQKLDNGRVQVDYDNAIRVLQELARNQPNNTLIWSSLVDCALARNEFNEARKFLNLARQMISDDSKKSFVLRKLSYVFLEQYEGSKNWDNQLAFEANVRVLNNAIYIVRGGKGIGLAIDLITSDKFEEKHAGWLSTATGGNSPPFLTHILLAIRELYANKQDGIEGAMFHFKVARESNKSANVYIAQFARAITSREDLDNGLALTIVETAESLTPADPYLLQARAEALMKQERYMEAAVALEKVLDRIRNSTDIKSKTLLLERLIECYRKSSNQEMLDKYEKQLERLKNPIPPT